MSSIEEVLKKNQISISQPIVTDPSPSNPPQSSSVQTPPPANLTEVVPTTVSSATNEVVPINDSSLPSFPTLPTTAIVPCDSTPTPPSILPISSLSTPIPLSQAFNINTKVAPSSSPQQEFQFSEFNTMGFLKALIPQDDWNIATQIFGRKLKKPEFSDNVNLGYIGFKAAGRLAMTFMEKLNTQEQGKLNEEDLAKKIKNGEPVPAILSKSNKPPTKHRSKIIINTSTMFVS